MSESVIVAGLHTLTIEEMAHLKGFVKKLKDEFMTEKVHYITLGEGEKAKQMLVKAGVEVLLMAFRLSPRFEVKEHEINLFGVSHKEVSSMCSLVSVVNGATIAQGMGLCSTLESRYRYVNAGKVCPDCGKEGTIRKSKQDGGWYCWDKLGGCGSKWAANHPDIKDQQQGKRDNADIADTYNTVLKMANMRALRDAVMTGLSASDIFDDSEDFEVPDYLMTGKVDATAPLAEKTAAASALMQELKDEARPASNNQQIAEPAPAADPQPDATPAPKPEANKPEAEKPAAKAKPAESNFEDAKKPEPEPEVKQPEQAEQEQAAPAADEEIDFDKKIDANTWLDIKKRLAAKGKTAEALCDAIAVKRGSEIKVVDMALVDAFIEQ